MSTTEFIRYKSAPLAALRHNASLATLYRFGSLPQILYRVRVAAMAGRLFISVSCWYFDFISRQALQIFSHRASGVAELATVAFMRPICSFGHIWEILFSISITGNIVL